MMLRLSAIVGLTILIQPGYSQPDRPGGAGAWIHDDQRQALAKYLEETKRAAALPLADLDAISRLISEPADQCRWLLQRADLLAGASPVDLDALGQLLDKVAERIKSGQERRSPGVAEAAPEWEKTLSALRAKTRPMALAEITEFAALRDRLKNPLDADFRELGPSQRLSLSARGVPASKLGVSATSFRSSPRPPAWYAPSIVMLRLLSADTLPKAQELISLQLELRKSESELAKEDAAVQPTARLMYDIAFAYLGRALGADVSAPSGGWGKAATTLDNAHLWSWAAMAGILQLGGTTTDAAARDAVLSRLEAMSGQLHEIHAVFPANEAGPDVGQRLSQWLSRLKNPSQPARGGMPLSTSFRATADRLRRQAKDSFVAAFDRGDFDEMFKQMQRAKAAEIAQDQADFDRLTTPVVTRRMLEDILGKAKQNGSGFFPKIDLFAEIIRCGEECYGVGIRAQTGSLGEDDSFEPVKESGQSAATVMDKLVPRYKTIDRTDQGIILSPDDLWRRLAWFEVCPRMARATENSKGWVVCVPTAAALATGSDWTMERSIRLWYRASTAKERLFFTPSRFSPMVVRVQGPVVSGRNVYALGFGSDAPADNSLWGNQPLLADLMRKLHEKKSLAIMPVVDAK